MINHIRTLLLNLPATSACRTGYTNIEYVDPSFIPVVLTPAAAKFYNTIFYGGHQMCLDQLKGYMSILHTELLNDYTVYFDKRITYDRTISVYRPLNYYWIDVNMVNNNVIDLLADPNILHSVFNFKSGQISEIYNIWLGSYETPIRFGAALLCFAFNMETLRHK